MNHDDWKELAEVYALGALDAGDRARFEGHLAACADCARAVGESAAVLADLASLSAVRPPAEVGERLMRRVRSSLSSPVPAVKSTPLTVWVGVGAAAAACLAFVLVRGLPEQAPAIPFAPAPGATARVPHDPKLVEMLHSEDSRFIRFEAAEGDPGDVKLVWNTKECRGCFSAKGLKPLPAGRTFQLWAIDSAGKAVSMGTFAADDQGHAHADFPAIDTQASYLRFAVTVEPGGGVLQPTGPMMFVGKL